MPGAQAELLLLNLLMEGFSVAITGIERLLTILPFYFSMRGIQTNRCKEQKSLHIILFLIFGYNFWNMETFRIEIINPKAKKLLKDLADLNLITIAKTIDNKEEFRDILLKLRSNADTAPSLDEITKEVEDIRASRYANKTK